MRYLPLLILLLAGCMTTQDIFSDVDNVLDRQVENWNNGDIPAFMEGYKNDMSLSFMGARGVNRGYNNVLSSYLTAYPDQKAMGKLKFTILERQRLDRRTVMYLGKYELEKDAAAFGYFTLIWKYVDGKWVIVHDHTTAGN
jgi:hypothetical protein